MARGLLNRRRALVALAAGSFAAGRPLTGKTAAGADDEKIDLGKVPAGVMEAAKKAVPGAKWSEAFKQAEDDGVVYSLEGEDAAGNHVWAEVTAAGKVNEVGSEIESAKVPPVVAAALKKRFPRFQASGTYEVRQDGKVIRYDFEGKRPRDKEDITVTVSPDGKTVEIAED